MEPNSTTMANGIMDKCTGKENSNGLMDPGTKASLFTARKKAKEHLFSIMVTSMKGIGSLASRKELELCITKIMSKLKKEYGKTEYSLALS